MVEKDKFYHFPRVWEKNVRAIILKAKEIKELRAETEDIIHLLGTQGHRSYRDLL